MSPEKQRIGAHVREIRGDLDLSVTEAATALGMSAEQYLALEADRIAPSALDLVNLVLLGAKVRVARELFRKLDAENPTR